MSRTIILIIVMLAAGLTTMSILDNREPQEPVAQKVCDFDPGTNALIVNYRCFKETLERTIQELEERKIPLGDATARVYSSSKVFCPIYLERVRISDPGATAEISVARNLVGHIRSLEEVDAVLVPRIAELEVELENLVNLGDGTSVR